MATIARKIILTKPFRGEPTLENFEIQEEKLAPLKNGEFLLEAEYLSVDPYMRIFTKNLPNEGVGATMIGGQVGR